MRSNSKNLIFIFEETDTKYDVSSKLVRLYMNRFIVDEDAEFEILGLSRIKFEREPRFKRNDLDKMIAMKIEKHDKIFAKLIAKEGVPKDAEIHILAGMPIQIPFYYSKIEKFISNKFYRMSSYTVLVGYRRQIRSKQHVLNAFQLENEGKPWLKHEGSKSLTINPDVDYFFRKISEFYQGWPSGGSVSSLTDLLSISRSLTECKRFYVYYKQLSESDIQVLNRNKPYSRVFMIKYGQMLNSFRNRLPLFTDKELDGSYAEYMGNRFTYFVSKKKFQKKFHRSFPYLNR